MTSIKTGEEEEDVSQLLPASSPSSSMTQALGGGEGAGYLIPGYSGVQEATFPFLLKPPL